MSVLALPGVGCLREQSFRLLFSSQLLSAVGDAVASVAVPFAIIALGGGAGDIGLVLGARAVPLVLFLLIGGVWADRMSRRTVMISSDAVRAGCQATFTAILLLGVGGVPAIVAITFVYGTAEAFFRPALSGILPQSVSPGRLQEAYGLIAMTPAVGMLAGGILGGTAVALISPAGAIALDAVTFAVAIVLLSFARFRVVAMAERGRSFLHDLRDGWDAFRRRTWLVVVVLGESFYALLVMPAIFVAGPLIAEEYLDGAASYAAIVSAFGLGFVTGGLIVARLTPRRPLVLAYAVTMPFVGTFIALSVPAPTAVIAACAWLGGTVIIISGSLLETTITRQVTPDLRSRVGSFRALGSQVCQPIGFGIAGVIIAGIGLSGMMWLAVAAVFANVAMVLATPSVRAMDDSAPGLA
ncbi:MAG: MFS transporter [Actinobacteria bacterium]|nr:MFS transporter [Actinomycetota bacterium]MBM3697773.1 MFS transporter [Actinomycetota bacterium]